MKGMDLTGTTVIVTGGGSGIGKGICMEFADHGAKVAVCDINREAAEGVSAEIHSKGRRAFAVEVDVTSEHEVGLMVERVVEKYGRIDVICNNAGIIPSMKNIAEMPVNDWEKTFAVNAKGVFICSKAVIPQMRKQGYGRILNTASQAGKKGIPLLGHYCASKASVILFTKTLALELAGENIHVNCICPGSVDTDMTDYEADLVSKKTGRPAVELKREWTEAVPMKKLASPRDIAKVFVFLASEYADYMTGQAVNVSGGQEMN
jgi:NAD(P)-dependent dehydrogenase (short-subunit alcohol dehydrogenase family)